MAKGDYLKTDPDAELKQLRAALDESVKLQSHYAWLLNQYDGGHRLTFVDGDEWMKRLAKVRK